MSTLADIIEEYISSLIREGDGIAEIQRAFLAERFRCAPSQISYVISSRFSPERGYIVESRKGGGGFIRLVKVELADDGVQEILDNIGPYLSQAEAYHYLDRLLDEGYINEQIHQMIRAATSRNALVIRLPERDLVRANVFRALLNAFFTFGEKESEENEV